MVCRKCGADLDDGCQFCTECGEAIHADKKSSDFLQKLKDGKIIKRINNLIDKFGEGKINKYFSLIAIFSMLIIRLFGFVFTAVLVTSANGYLVYHEYKKTAKIDSKMIIWSACVLLAGILIWLQSRIIFI